MSVQTEEKEHHSTAESLYPETQFSSIEDTQVEDCVYIASTRITKCEEDAEFNVIFRRAQEAMAQGVHPELIAAGSSGSYFVRSVDGTNLAVFKPKDEEPFAALNPKWPKFFQRVLCFCCFGRACLIPNSGYLSETGASIVDAALGLNIVPKTRVVKLASPAFFYTRCCGMKKEIRPKEGSFQLFVSGYESAYAVFARWEYDKKLLSEEEDRKFTVQFQMMCVLDYVIRNTDRHLDNLLIRHVPGKVLELAAIDNGLAFPIKHPESASRLRTYPFRWADLQWAKRPFDADLRAHLIELLTPRFVHDLCRELKALFHHPIGSNRILVFSQLRVVRGQIYNLRHALLVGETAAEMAQREPVLLSRNYRKQVPNTDEWMRWFRMRPIDTTDRACC